MSDQVITVRCGIFLAAAGGTAVKDCDRASLKSERESMTQTFHAGAAAIALVAKAYPIGPTPQPPAPPTKKNSPNRNRQPTGPVLGPDSAPPRAREAAHKEHERDVHAGAAAIALVAKAYPIGPTPQPPAPPTKKRIRQIEIGSRPVQCSGQIRRRLVRARRRTKSMNETSMPVLLRSPWWRKPTP